MTAKHRFGLHLPGLLKVLAEHLYGSRNVGVRELLQNAHDSCVRRRIEEQGPRYRPRIDLTTDERQQTLTIRDNGCGLTEEEIHTYLATIGRGYTRELRELLGTDSPSEAGELIGQFGLGFLSAFLLAREVTVTTRSYKGGPTLRWSCSGDEHFGLAPAPDQPIGTSVELQLKPAAAFLLEAGTLEDVVRNYADFLPTPIHVEGDHAPANCMLPPWEADDPEEACRAYARRAGRSDPLWVLPLTDEKINLGHDTLTVPLRGFLFVPPSSVASVSEHGDLSIYIRRMFICDRERHLLPPWARFVRGVIDCPVLQPTASREGIHQDDSFTSVRNAIEAQLTRGLRNLARRDPDGWRRLVRAHADLVVGWAVKDDGFFESIKDVVPFRTTRGLLSLPEYLACTNGTIYYVTRELGSLQDQLLAEGRDLPAIDASWFEVPTFLNKYARQKPGVGLKRLDVEADELMRPAPEGDLAPLAAYCRAQGWRFKVAAFRPAEVPALMLYPPGAETAAGAGRALRRKEVAGGLAGLIKAYVEDHPGAADDHGGTLYLNASCGVLRKLAQASPSPEVLAATLIMLRQLARLFCGRALTAADAAAAFGDFTDNLERIALK
jgi:molecular chaperone HtpG